MRYGFSFEFPCPSLSWILGQWYIKDSVWLVGWGCWMGSQLSRVGGTRPRASSFGSMPSPLGLSGFLWLPTGNDILLVHVLWGWPFRQRERKSVLWFLVDLKRAKGLMLNLGTSWKSVPCRDERRVLWGVPGTSTYLLMMLLCWSCFFLFNVWNKHFALLSCILGYLWPLIWKDIWCFP